MILSDMFWVLTSLFLDFLNVWFNINLYDILILLAFFFLVFECTEAFGVSLIILNFILFSSTLLTKILNLSVFVYDSYSTQVTYYKLQLKPRIRSLFR